MNTDSPLTPEDLDLLRRPLHGVEQAADRADELAGMLAIDWVRLVLHPEKVSRFVN